VTVDTDAAARARRLVAALGGRYSREVGIDVGGGADEVERWFLASTLFGTRIRAATAARTFRVLDEAGLVRVARARGFPWNDLVALLDRGGYTRYDFRTATRLHVLADVLNDRYGGEVAEIGRRYPAYLALRAALDALPGWGPVTVEVFLRELRGVWSGAEPPLDDRAARAARHLELVSSEDPVDALGELRQVCRAAELDVRDLESALVRLTLAHRADSDTCPGADACRILTHGTSDPRGGR
jgi:endonuclease III